MAIMGILVNVRLSLLPVIDVRELTSYLDICGTGVA